MGLGTTRVGEPDAGNLHVRFDEGVGLYPPTLLDCSLCQAVGPCSVTVNEATIKHRKHEGHQGHEERTQKVNVFFLVFLFVLFVRFVLFVPSRRLVQRDCERGHDQATAVNEAAK